MNNGREIRIIATITLWMAPMPAAFFVGRSVYYHLIHTWHLPLGVLGLVAAVISGMMIELVGILSAHTALATGRWNKRGDVRRKHSHKERAPFGWAVGCFSVYALAAVALAVVLEWVPEFAVAAPALFTIMAAAAYLSVGIYEQHLDRLRRYGLGWAWLALAEKDEQEHSETEPGQKKSELDKPPQFGTKREHIRYLMKTEPGLTQTELALRSGASASYVSELVKGQNGLNAHSRKHKAKGAEG